MIIGTNGNLFSEQRFTYYGTGYSTGKIVYIGDSYWPKGKPSVKVTNIKRLQDYTNMELITELNKRLINGGIR